MNIRDVAGVDTPQELYEIASKHGIHVGSMDHLVRFAVEIQRRAMNFEPSYEAPAELSSYLTQEPK